LARSFPKGSRWRSERPIRGSTGRPSNSVGFSIPAISRIGGTSVVPFHGRHAVKVGYSTGVVTDFGTDLDQILVSYQVLFR
jgi:hypothetical protein